MEPSSHNADFFNKIPHNGLNNPIDLKRNPTRLNSTDILNNALPPTPNNHGIASSPPSKCLDVSAFIEALGNGKDPSFDVDQSAPGGSYDFGTDGFGSNGFHYDYGVSDPAIPAKTPTNFSGLSPADNSPSNFNENIDPSLTSTSIVPSSGYNGAAQAKGPDASQQPTSASPAAAPTPLAAGKYLCMEPGCNQVFTGQRILDEHYQKVHGIEHRHKCSNKNCSYSCTRDDNLKSHKKDRCKFKSPAGAQKRHCAPESTVSPDAQTGSQPVVKKRQRRAKATRHLPTPPNSTASTPAMPLHSEQTSANSSPSSPPDTSPRETIGGIGPATLSPLTPLNESALTDCNIIATLEKNNKTLGMEKLVLENELSMLKEKYSDLEMKYSNLDKMCLKVAWEKLVLEERNSALDKQCSVIQEEL
ncbi:hypothetical protein TWF730_007450 [Orbilia blumenaviensis]|uniref:C2H2-type domain-containing protein n=1 Tax=Orbilia blumenaviensis TaxID=1796055 RepID=A0AAV9V7V4_9PEZI